MKQILNIHPLSSADDEKLKEFIFDLDEYLNQLYPSESNHIEPIEELVSAQNCLFGAYLENQLVGIGAAKFYEEYAELKRFYVPKFFRGQGIAESIIAALELRVCLSGIQKIFLETGVHQKEALSFYYKLGYTKCAPFGDYSLDPNSVFMEKSLLSFNVSNFLEDLDFYYTAFFKSSLNEPENGYKDIAQKMESLVQQQSGFLGASSVRLDDGRGYTASYWDSLESIALWKENNEHQIAQKMGREVFYKSFQTYISKVLINA